MDRRDRERVTLHLSCGSLFDDCSDSDVRKVINAGLLNSYHPGEHIFWKDDAGQALYAIVAGRVEIRLPKEGEEVVLAELGHGEIFGEMALISGELRTASAVAASELELFVLNESELGWLMTKYPKIAVNLLRNLLRVTADRLRGELERFERDVRKTEPAA